MSEQPVCELCGDPMPAGEEMFKFHGYSGPCPKPIKPLSVKHAAVLQALKPFAYAYESLMREAHDALQVGGYVPTEDTATREVPVGWLRIAHEVVEGK